MNTIFGFLLENKSFHNLKTNGIDFGNRAILVDDKQVLAVDRDIDCIEERFIEGQGGLVVRVHAYLPVIDMPRRRGDVNIVADSQHFADRTMQRIGERVLQSFGASPEVHGLLLVLAHGVTVDGFCHPRCPLGLTLRTRPVFALSYYQSCQPARNYIQSAFCRAVIN